MSLYNNKEIEEMNFEELRAEVSAMRSELTKYKRLLDLFTEDLENSALGKSLTMENGKLRTEIKAVAGEISTKVEDLEEELTTQITQNAESITAVAKDADEKIAELELNAEGLRSYVARAAKLSEAQEVSAKKDMTDTDEIYVIRDKDNDGNIMSEAYYYYDIASEDWELASEETIYTVFEQYGNGFRLKGNVRISGDLISEGTIDGIRVQSSDDSGNVICLMKGYLYLYPETDEDSSKFSIGMYEINDTYCPYIVFGEGSGSESKPIAGLPIIRGTMLMEKDINGFNMAFTPSDGSSRQGIYFHDSTFDGTARIAFFQNTRVDFGHTVLDFENATITGLRVTFG